MNDNARAIVHNLQHDGLAGEKFEAMQGSWAETYATRILRDPQAHVDALVEAGVLERCQVAWLLNTQFATSQMISGGYRLLPHTPPHEHDWRLNPRRHGNLLCADPECGEWRELPRDMATRPKSEWPKYTGPDPS